MDIQLEIKKRLHFLGPDLIGLILKEGKVLQIAANKEILSEGQYVKVIPLVLDGLIKVYTRYEEKELLLYYIEPFESCIMSFSAGLNNQPSIAYAVTEEDTTVLALPVDQVNEWIKIHPSLNDLMYNQYNQRYAALLETIKYLLYHKMDKRIMDHLVQKCQVKGSYILRMKHKQIAAEVGTAREVVSRVLKKLEKEGKVRQLPEGLEILTPGD